jgi:hypothetical protein
LTLAADAPVAEHAYRKPKKPTLAISIPDDGDMIVVHAHAKDKDKPQKKRGHLLAAQLGHFVLANARDDQ